jgi:ketosteroid isomerase-like protein
MGSAMTSNRDIVTDAFRSWANGDGYVASIFADDMTWEITGRSVVSKKYAGTQQFIDDVLHPFSARFSSGDPFRPVNIRRQGHRRHGLLRQHRVQRTLGPRHTLIGTATRKPRPGERSPSRH